MGYRALICGVVLVLPACGSDGDETVDSLDTSETGSGDDTGTTPTSSESGDASTDSTDPDTTDGDTSSDDSSGSDTGGPTASPTAVGDTYFVAQGSELQIVAAEGVLANDTHPDGASLTVTMSDAASAAEGAVTVSPDGHFTYTPVPNHWGADSFAYTISDDDGDTASGVVNIVVTPVRIPLEDVADGFGGFALDGEQPFAYSATLLGGGGDFNDDGVSDVLISAPGFQNYQGRGYVVFGGDKPRSTAFSDIAEGMGGMAITGSGMETVSSTFDAAGDVDGDGIDDILVGAQGKGSQRGGGYVVFGTPGLASLSTNTIAAGAGGFAIDGITVNEHIGANGSAVGDVDGDGLADVALASYVWANVNDDTNRVYVVLGKSDTENVDIGDVIAGIGGFVIVAHEQDHIITVGAAGDLDADGLGDLIVGAAGSAVAGQAVGRAYVVFGKEDTDAVALSDIADGVGGFAIDGESPDDYFGWPVDAAGDVNGDGLTDVTIGSFGPDGSGRGRGYVLLGSGDRVPVTAQDIAAGIGGFVIDGANGHVGARNIAGSGDVNGDGLDDLIVGVGGDTVTTPIHVVFGKVDTSPVDLGDVGDGHGGYTIDPEAGYGSYTSVAGIGDFDGDGIGDVIVGLNDMLSSAGRSYVVYGVRTQ